MTRGWALMAILALAALVLRVDADGSTCQAPSVPDPASPPIPGCAAPGFSVNPDPNAPPPSPTEVVDVSETVVSQEPSPPAAPPTPAPPVGSGAGVPMVQDEGMGRVQPNPQDARGHMLQAAGLADAMRGAAINPQYTSDLNYLDGYSKGQMQRVLQDRQEP